jgi:methionine-rich copper-binding protein CopC
MTNLDVGGDQIKRKAICSVILLLAFALILNVNASSAATVNGTSSMNSSVKSDLSPTVTNPINSVSANTSKTSTNLVSTTTEPVTTASNAVNTNTAVVTTTTKAVTKDKTPPKVIKTNPVNNKNIHTTAPNKTITLTFNEKIALKSGWIVLVNSKGTVIPTKISIKGSTLTVDPVSNLVNSMLYKLSVHRGSIMDLSGNTNVLYVLNFGVQPKVQPVPAALKKYLLATANCQSTNPKIKALAKSITKGSTSQYTSAAKIYNWVRDNINYAFYYNTQKGALGTLSSRSANCADTAHLMVALERAAGIPARYEHIYAHFSSGNWYGHVIAQVYIDGKWYYADGTSYRNSFGVVKNWNTATFKYEGVYASLPF